jgi:phosphate-selective porin OprO and OprP
MKKNRYIFILTIIAWNFAAAQVIENDNLQLKIGGDIQIDTRNYIDNTVSADNNFLIRRARISLRGTYLKIFEFRIMPNFPSGGTLEIQDAYGIIKFSPLVTLRGGKFKTPVGLEIIQSPTKMTFIERGLTYNLVPNRDLGFELSGSIGKNIVNYSAGIYNGVVDRSSEDTDSDNNKEFAGRIFIQPFIENKESFLNNFGLGVSITAGNQNGTVSNSRLGTYRTTSQNTFFRFRDSVAADGKRIRIVPQAYLFTGRFSFLGEYVINQQNIQRNLSSVEATNTAWQAAFSFFLTNDEKTFNSVKPNTNFDPSGNGWGAFEVAFRYNELIIDDILFPFYSNPNNSAKKATNWSIALNWYMNEVFRIAINYENTSFESFGNSPNLKDDKALLTRLQIAF